MRTRERARVLGFVAAVVALVGLVGAVRAEDYVGWVSALEGTGEVQRAGASEWVGIAPADGLALGDHVRTQANSRMKILLRDDSLLTLGESSQLRLDESVVGAAPTSSFELLFGTIRAIATERYGAAGAKFEVKTPTAIAGVRGTEFIARHDPREDETLVVGVVDTTMVRAVSDRAGARAVRLGPGDFTRVRRGSYPSAATKIPADQLQSLTDATTARDGAAAGQGKSGGSVQAEPRLPTRPGDREGSPVERVVDNPFAVGKGSKRPVPPPPPPPRN